MKIAATRSFLSALLLASASGASDTPALRTPIPPPVEPSSEIVDVDVDTTSPEPKPEPLSGLTFVTPQSCAEDIQTYCTDVIQQQPQGIVEDDSDLIMKLLSSGKDQSISSPESSMRFLDNLFSDYYSDESKVPAKNDLMAVPKMTVIEVHAISSTNIDQVLQQIIEDIMATSMTVSAKQDVGSTFDSMVGSLIQHSTNVHENKSSSSDSPIELEDEAKDYYNPDQLTKQMADYGKFILQEKDLSTQSTERRMLARRLSEVTPETTFISTTATEQQNLQKCLWNVIDKVSSTCKTDLTQARNIIRCGKTYSGYYPDYNYGDADITLVQILIPIFIARLGVVPKVGSLPVMEDDSPLLEDVDLKELAAARARDAAKGDARSEQSDDDAPKGSDWLSSYARSQPLEPLEFARARLHTQAKLREDPEALDDDNSDDDYQLVAIGAEPAAEPVPDAEVEVEVGARSSMRKKTSKVKKTVEEVPTNADQLWDMLTTRGGYMTTTVEAHTMVDIFDHCARTGLNAQVSANLRPVREGEVLEGLSIDDFARLLVLVMTDQPYDEFDEEDLRRRLRELERKGSKPRDDDNVKLKHYRKLLSCISTLLHMDKAFILAHMVWTQTNRLEMTEELTVMVMEQCAFVKEERSMGDKTAIFTRNDYMRMCHACGVVDASGEKGIPWPNLAALFSGMLEHKQELLSTRASLKTKSKPKKEKPAKGRAASGVSGQTEFSILIEAIYGAMPDEAGYGSPLQMVSKFLENVQALAPVVHERSAFDLDFEKLTSPSMRSPTPTGGRASRVSTKVDKSTTVDKTDALKERFKRLDKNHDGFLDFDEFSTLLRQGNPNFSKRELEALFTLADANADGVIAFEEFVDYIFNKEGPGSGGISNADSPTSPSTTLASTGRSVFTRLVPRGSGAAPASTARDTRKDRSNPLDAVSKAIGSAAHAIGASATGRRAASTGRSDMANSIRVSLVGPSEGGRAGSRLRGPSPAGEIGRTSSKTSQLDPSRTAGRSVSQTRSSPGRTPSKGSTSPIPRGGDEDTDWRAAAPAFSAATDRGRFMEAKEFTKLVKDSGLLDSKLRIVDAEMIFSTVCPRFERRITVQQFWQAVQAIADRKGCPVEDILIAVRRGAERS